MRRRTALAVLLVALLALPAAAKPPKEAVFDLDGVRYLYATGVNGTETAMLGDRELPFVGCAFMMLHPGTPNGRVTVRGLLDNRTLLEMNIERFRLPDGEPGYAYDVPAQADGRDVLADVAIAGNASIKVNTAKYPDPVSSTGDPTVDRENPSLEGRLVITQAGLRDDATGAPAPQPARDAEMHLAVRSRPEAQPATTRFTLEGNSTLPTEGYSAYHLFDNAKLGGQATLAISLQATAPDGMNEVSFAVLAPSGAEIGNATLSAALLAPDDATLGFPLDELGTYLVRATGKMAFGSYTIDAELAPPPSFELRLWWENVTYGYQAYQDRQACGDSLGSPNAVVATDSVVGRPPPPSFLLKIVAFAVLAVGTLVTVAVKLASDQLSLAAFRKSK